jgi:hypothetical protein
MPRCRGTLTGTGSRRIVSPLNAVQCARASKASSVQHCVRLRSSNQSHHSFLVLGKKYSVPSNPSSPTSIASQHTHLAPSVPLTQPSLAPFVVIRGSPKNRRPYIPVPTGNALGKRAANQTWFCLLRWPCGWCQGGSKSVGWADGVA